MADFFGDQRRFAVEVGEWAGPSLRRVDLWVAGQWVTCDDNVVYVKQFRRDAADTALWLRSGHGASVPFAGLSPVAVHRRLVAGSGCEQDDDELRRRFRAFDRWGPTTDNVLAFLFRQGEQLTITVQFWREEHLCEHPGHAGTVFALEIRAGELVEILEGLVAVLGCDESPVVN